MVVFMQSKMTFILTYFAMLVFHGNTLLFVVIVSVAAVLMTVRIKTIEASCDIIICRLLIPLNWVDLIGEIFIAIDVLLIKEHFFNLFKEVLSLSNSIPHCLLINSHLIS